MGLKLEKVMLKQLVYNKFCECELLLLLLLGCCCFVVVVVVVVLLLLYIVDIVNIRSNNYYAQT
jgi:hypothetical protein